MADSILDIVHRISYEVTGQQNVAAIQRTFQSNIESITRNTASLARLQAQLNQTSDPRRQAALTQAIANRTRAINEQQAAMQRTIQTDRTFQQSLQREIGIINELNSRLNSLRTARNAATSQNDIRGYDRQISAAERELRRASGGGIVGGIGNSLLQGIGIGSGIQIFDTVIGKVGQLVTESSRLAAELEGVRPAFDRLNDPNLLQGLRDATKGTVSDLELMKQAVQFSNFGLPVERMSEALRFARIRARETGQSVDYLVQSIVTGIGRQSPLILDNLGINAKRVSGEFARTGDFAQAAFNIISEEASKSGADLDTFTESVARFNAELENTQAALGKDLNDIFTTFKVLGADAVGSLESLTKSILTYGATTVDIETKNSEAFKKLVDERNKQAELAPQIQEQSNTIYLATFKRFAEEYANTDQAGRQRIVEQARQMNDAINTEARAAYAFGSDQLRIYLEGAAGAFQRFQNQIKTSAIRADLINPTNVRGLTREQLTEAQEANDKRRNSLTGRDTSKAAEIAATDKLIKEQLDIINGQVAKPANRVNAPKVKPIDFEKLKADILKGYRKLTIELSKEISSSSDYIIDPRQNADIIFNPLSDLQNEETPEQRRLAAQISLGEDIAEFNRKQREREEESEKESLERRKDAYSDLYSSVINGAAMAFNSILDAQIRAAEREIEYRSGTVEKAKELAQRGNTEVLEQEEEQLRKATAARQAAADKQIQLNALLQASNMAVALSEAIGAIVAAAAEGDPYTIAARVIAAVAALVGGVAALSGAFSSANAGFAEGGYVGGKGGFTGNGGKYEPAGTVHKGEFVFTKEKTSQFRSVFEDIHNGRIPIIPDAAKGVIHPLYVPMIPNSGSSDSVSRKEFKKLGDKLDEVVYAIDNIKISARQSMDANGVAQTVEKVRRADRNRFN